jgi:antitoxin (DNA-binding transcriptional repressor) of toxin-antitoxin stability system
MMTHRLSTTELVERLPDLLARVQDRGERFVIERDGEPIATLAPPDAPRGITLGELAERLADLEWPDDGFADDLEEIQAEMNRQPLKIPEWPS